MATADKLQSRVRKGLQSKEGHARVCVSKDVAEEGTRECYTGKSRVLHTVRRTHRRCARTLR